MDNDPSIEWEEWFFAKRWITGPKATMEQEGIGRDVYSLVRQYMSNSGLLRIPDHVPLPSELYFRFGHWNASIQRLVEILLSIYMIAQCANWADVKQVFA